jgi:hypothetical protein
MRFFLQPVWGKNGKARPGPGFVLILPKKAMDFEPLF